MRKMRKMHIRYAFIAFAPVAFSFAIIAETLQILNGIKSKTEIELTHLVTQRNI